jgi:hypothetical protein
LESGQIDAVHAANAATSDNGTGSLTLTMLGRSDALTLAEIASNENKEHSYPALLRAAVMPFMCD